MNSNNKSEDIFWKLRQNKRITNETIISLINYEFDSNEALNALNFDLDLPQMTDICDQQKQCLRQVLTQIRQKSKHSNEDNSILRPQIINLFKEFNFVNIFRLKEVPNEDINSLNEKSEQINEVFNETSDEYSTIDLENIQQLDEEYKESNAYLVRTKVKRNLRNKTKCSSETKLKIKRKRETNSEINLIQKNIKRNENGFTCLYTDCGKTFPDSKYIHCHIRSHLGIKPFKCHFKGCDYKSVSSSHLKRHISGVHRLNDLKCNECKTSFKSKFHLNTHKIRTHPKINSNENEVQKYIKRDKNQFVCRYADCGQQFQYNHHLKRHIKRHLDIKPFKCQYEGCDYKSDDSSHLTLHVSRFHRFKGDLKCNQCKTSFKTKFDLRTHKSRAHPKN